MVVSLALFTLLPAGFVGYVPADSSGIHAVRAVHRVDPAYLALAIAIFNRGLRRYSSGPVRTFG